MDYLSRHDLIALGLTAAEAEALLARSPITGHGGLPVVAAEDVADLLAEPDETDHG